MSKHIILDTNTILSAALTPKSISYQAVQKASLHFQIVLSTPIWNEIQDIFSRKKFEKYISEESRLIFLTSLKQNAVFIEPTEIITDCRDSKDNKFLELAVASDAHFIITGDEDLLILNPYRNIMILKSGDFLNLD